MSEIVDSIVIRVVADVDDAERRIAAYAASVETGFGTIDDAAARSDAALTRSSHGQRQAAQALGQQLSAAATEAIGGASAFDLLGKHGIEAAATLEKFGGAVGEVGTLLSGPWGVAAQFAVSLLGKLAARYLDNERDANAAAAAAQSFAASQADISGFIDLTTGKLIEQNQALVQNRILTEQKAIADNDRLIRQGRAAIDTAIRDLPGKNVFVAERQPTRRELDPDLARRIDPVINDMSALAAVAARLKQERPGLGKTLDAIIAAAARVSHLQARNAQAARTVRGLAGDASAFARNRVAPPEPEANSVAAGRAAKASEGAERGAAQRASTAPPARPARPAADPTPAAQRAASYDEPRPVPDVRLDPAGLEAPTAETLYADVAAIAAAWATIDVSKFEAIDTAQLERVAQISQKLSDDLAEGLGDAIVAGRSLGDVLVDSFARAGVALLKSQITRLLDPVGNGASGFVRDAAGAFGWLTGTTPAPRRASGGHVAAGQLYRVNERGPEGFRPAGSGTIIPLGRMAAPPHGGGVTVVQPMNVSFAGAITTPELMAQFKAYADGVGRAAMLGGAAMAQAKLARRATRSLPG